MDDTTQDVSSLAQSTLPENLASQVDPQVLQQIMAGMNSQAPQGPQGGAQGQANNIATAQAQPIPQIDPNAISQQSQSSSQLPPQIAALAQAGSQSPLPMMPGGIPASQANQVPHPTIGGLPGLVMDLINPGRNVQAGQPAPSKLDRFESFLGSFLQSLSAGFSQEGHGPGSFGRGLGAAMQAPYQSAIQQYQMQEQTQQQQAQIALEKARVGAMTPSVPVTDPRTGQQLNVAPADLGKYLAAGYRYEAAKVGADSREKVAETKASPQAQILKDAQAAYDKGDMATYNAKLKEATQVSTAAKPQAGMQSPFGKLTPEMAAVGMPPNYQDADKYPLGMKDPAFLKDVRAYGQQVAGMKQKELLQQASARGMSYAYGRAAYTQVPVLDQTTQTPTFRTPLEIARNPQAYMPLAEGDKAMMKNGVFEDINGANKNLRKAIIANKDGFSPSQVVLMTAAMNSIDSGGTAREAASNLIQSAGRNALTGPQKDQAIATLQAYENGFALRGVAGYGAGSDSLRSAIKATYPSAGSPPDYALKQMDAIDGQVSRLLRGVPRVQIRPEGGGDTATPKAGQYSPGNPFAPKK